MSARANLSSIALKDCTTIGMKIGKFKAWDGLRVRDASPKTASAVLKSRVFIALILKVGSH
jgi:hypothetical protein